jgi:hypothetical protein
VSDPTGTAGLRRSFQAEGNRRLAQLRSQTHAILVERDLMAARNDPLSVLMPNPGHRLSAFNDWFTRTVRALLVGEEWWGRFLQRAFDSGAVAGGELVGRPPRGFTPVPAVYRELALGEFAGIAQALIQQVTRQAGMAAIGGLKPTRIYRAVLTSLRKVGEARLKSAVNSLTVQLHNTGRLTQFQVAGVAQVGIDAEQLEPRRPSRFLKHDHMHDASAAEELKRLREIMERQRAEAQERAAAAEVAAERARAALEAQIAAELAGERTVQESKEAARAALEAAREQARAEVAAERALTAARNLELKVQTEAVKAAREAERLALHPERRPTETGIPRPQPPFKGPPGYETVRKLLFGKPALPARLLGIGAEFLNVVTAGDDRVCAECEDLAAEGPYSLLEAWGMLPAHVNCRCAFVPFLDKRNQELEADIE